MITYTITGDAVTVSDNIREYVHNHYQTFEKFVDAGDTKEMQIVISKNTAHHRQDTFKVEVSFKIKRGDFFITVDNAEVMSALDEAKEVLLREVASRKDKHMTLFHRGARKVKAFAKGLRSR